MKTSDVVYWQLVSGDGQRYFSRTITKVWWDALNTEKAFLVGYSRHTMGWKAQWFRFVSATETITPQTKKCEVRVVRVGEPWFIKLS